MNINTSPLPPDLQEVLDRVSGHLMNRFEKLLSEGCDAENIVAYAASSEDKTVANFFMLEEWRATIIRFRENDTFDEQDEQDALDLVKRPALGSLRVMLHSHVGFLAVRLFPKKAFSKGGTT